MSGMDEQTRTRYLKAMGITRWTLRVDDPGTVEPEETPMPARASAVSVPAPERMAQSPEHTVSVTRSPEILPDTVVPPDVLQDMPPEAGRVTSPQGGDSWEILLEDIGACRRCGMLHSLSDC